MKLLAHLLDFKSLTENERVFFTNWYKNLNYQTAVIARNVAILLNLATFCFYFFFGHELNRILGASVHGVFAAFLTLTYLLPKHKKSLEGLLNINLCAITLMYLYFLRKAYTMPELASVTDRAFFSCLVVSIIHYAILGNKATWIVFYAVLYSILIFIVTYGQENHFIWYVLFTGSSIAYLVAYARITQNEQVNARSIYSFRSQILPQYLLRNSDYSELDPNTVAPPAFGDGIYIYTNLNSHNWAYQENQLKVKELSEQIIKLLFASFSKHFPRGNYFIDYVSDDVSITIIPVSDTSITEYIQPSLCAITESIQLFTSIQSGTNFPSSIDFGISYGSAFYGVLGHKDYAKFTSQGELVDKAKFLQLSGEMLRDDSKHSFIIFDQHFANSLSSSFDTKTWTPDTGQFLRNLPEQKVNYISVSNKEI